MEGGNALERTALTNKGVLARFAIAAVHADIEDLRIVAGPRHPSDATDRVAPGELLGEGWVLVPAHLGDSNTGPAPGYAASSHGGLFAFYPDATKHELLASPQPLDLSTVNEAWLAAAAAAAAVRMKDPDYIASSLQMQTYALAA